MSIWNLVSRKRINLFYWFFAKQVTKHYSSCNDFIKINILNLQQILKDQNIH